jgi:hypothetical protein
MWQLDSIDGASKGARPPLLVQFLNAINVYANCGARSTVKEKMTLSGDALPISWVIRESTSNAYQSPPIGLQAHFTYPYYYFNCVSLFALRSS